MGLLSRRHAACEVAGNTISLHDGAEVPYPMSLNQASYSRVNGGDKVTVHSCVAAPQAQGSTSDCLLGNA